jgi:hypothetical protein
MAQVSHAALDETLSAIRPSLYLRFRVIFALKGA